MRHVICVWCVLVVGDAAADGRLPGPVLRPRELVPPGSRAARVKPLASPLPPPCAHLAGGSVAVHAASGEVFAAETDNGTVVVAAPDGRTVRRTIAAVGGGPEQVVVAPDGRAFVSLRESGEVALVDAGAAAVARRVDVGDEPFGLAYDAERDLLYVSLAGQAAVVGLDGTSLARRLWVAVDANPRGLALTPDGGKLFVAHLTGRSLSVIHLPERAVHRVPLAATLPPGGSVPNLTFALALSPDGRTLHAAHVLEDTGRDRAPEGGYGAGVTDPIVAAVSSFDVEAEALVGRWPRHLHQEAGTLSFDFDVFSQARAVAVDPTAHRIFVAAFGSSEVRMFGTGGDAPLLLGRLQLPARSGPRGLALSADGTRLYVQTDFDHAVTTVDVSRAARRPFGAVARLAIGQERMPPDAVAGRRLFFSAGDPRIAAAGQLACGSCHPEGRSDGMVWQVEEGPRKTPVLADRLVDTAPYDWEGRQATLEQHIQHTMTQRLGGRGVSRRAMGELVSYLTRYCRLPPRRAPLSPLAARGQALFASDEVGCAHCHDPARRFHDGKRHDVGTMTRIEARRLQAEACARAEEAARIRVRAAQPYAGQLVAAALDGTPLPATPEEWERWGEREVRRARERAVKAAAAQRIAYDTPSLVGIGRGGGPFLHDGSAPSLRALLTTMNPGDRMGRTSELSPSDVDALVAYLETL